VRRVGIVVGGVARLRGFGSPSLCLLALCSVGLALLCLAFGSALSAAVAALLALPSGRRPPRSLAVCCLVLSVSLLWALAAGRSRRRAHSRSLSPPDALSAGFLVVLSVSLLSASCSRSALRWAGSWPSRCGPSRSRSWLSAAALCSPSRGSLLCWTLLGSALSRSARSNDLCPLDGQSRTDRNVI